MTKRPAAADIQAHLCELAQTIARDHFSLTLDFTPDSVWHVETILSEMHLAYVESESDEGMTGVALEFAAYIVTVIQRDFGPAKWERDCESFGEDAFPLHWDGGKIYPLAWCMKRIFDGPGDDVWTKFQSLVVNKRVNNVGG
ncbi:hypothetical protein [Crateriforma conspicua]|uniref:hypothetical protein n=1 Tax=Crateriforma conspicua TaxID=2527996 RepID=UPI00118CCD07|nr:hypothetical protein [Crateriforma conspicua]QDV61107.1 hypothetical protein Mal65_02300 [Crateriforma conspicua]QDV61141.1 hypothetical protein Mal65_02640 [Crateriforma conspicua]